MSIMELKSIIYLLVVFSGVSVAFDFFEGNSQIPSDGFHDLLGLTPFWLQQPIHDDLRRTLGMKRDNLPNFDDFKSRSGGSSTYQMAALCNLKGTFKPQKAKLEVQDVNGCTKPSLTTIFQRLFPAVNLDEASGNFIMSDQFDFDELEVDKRSQEVTVKATAKDTLAYVERRILLGEGKLTIGFPASASTAGGIKPWTVNIKGIVGISSHRVKMVIDKPKGEVNLPFTWEIPMVLMVDLMGIFGITSSAMNFNDIGFDGSKIDGVTFAGATIKGQLNPKDDTFQLVAKASVAMSQASPQADWWLILTRPAGQVTKPAIIIDVKDTINIKDALEVFIRQKDFISDFGMIGRIERDCIIMLAKDDIVMVQNEDLTSLVSKFIPAYDTKQIPKGVNVRVLVPMKGNMQENCGNNKEVKLPADLPEILPITIKITAGGLSFTFPDKFKSDLPSMLQCMDPQMKAELPSQLFPKPGGLINIKEFTAAQGGKYVKLTITLQGPFKFLGGKINLSDVDLSVSKQKGEKWQFSATTTVTVGPLSVGLTLDKDGGKYTFSAYVESFKLNQLDKLIGKTTLTKFVSRLGKLSDFGIKDFKLIKEFGESSSLRVSGVPILWGWDKCTIEGLVWKPDKSKPKNSGQPNTAVAVGIVIEAIRLDKLMEKILGNNFFSVAWFSEMTAICIVSNADGKVEASEDAKPNKLGDEKDESSSSGSSRRLIAQPDKRHYIPKAAPKKIYSKRASVVKVLRRRRRSTAGGQQYIKPPYAQKIRGSMPYPKAVADPSKVTHAKRAGDKDTESSNDDSNKKNDDDDDDDDEAIIFNTPYLTSQDIESGLTFIGIFNIPQDNGCKGDSLCLWLGEKVGRDATIEIMGAISDDSFKFGAKFSGTIVLIENKLTLQEIELSLELSGKKSSVKLSCTLYWADRDILGEDQLQFQGAIEVSLTGKLNLEFNMMGMWTRPFGFEYLAFGNLHLAIGIAVGVPIPSFEFGAEVWVGKIKKGMQNNDHAIKVAGYFGIDVNRPRDNYVYGSINAFTIAKVFEAFELGEPNLPKFVANTGFPEGITVAYSTTGKDIEAHDISIAAGLYLKAKISFLGFNLSSEIIVNPGKKLMIDISMSPIDWAWGLIKLRRNETDTKNGPKAFIYLTPDSTTVQIEGYVSLLGVSRYIKIDISDTGIEFTMETKLWDMIEARLHVSAAYGSWASLAFSFRASVKIDLHFDRIFNAVKEVMKKAADAATEALESAQDRLKDAKSSLSNADNKMAGWQSDMSAYQNKLRARSAEIERQKKQMEENCKAKCGKVCIPFFGWKSRCFKIWWWWVGCPTWDHCKWKVDNIICIAGCEIAKIGKKFVAWAEQVGISIIIGLTEIGKGLLDVGRGFVKLADKLVDFANDVLEFAKKAVAVGKRILSDVLDWLAENLFKIDLLELRGSLDKDFNACLGLTVKCVILGLKIDYDGNICINLNFWKSLGSDLAEKKYPGIKKQDQEVQKLDGKFEEFDKDKADLDEEEKNIDADVKKETSQRRKRDYVPTAEEAYYRRLAVEPLPAVVTRGAETVEAFKTSAPWVLAQDFDIRDFDHTPHVDDSIPAEKRTLHEDWEKHTPCVQIHKVIDKYSMIADGLSTLSESLRDVRGNYQATKRSMQQGVEALEGQVNDIENKHNMTLEERSDLYHWYDEAKDGLKKWDEKTSAIVDEHHELAIPTFRSQINHILNKEKKTNFVGYMNELHEVGKAAYKRSNIPNANMIAAAQELQGIKRDLVNIVNSDDSSGLKLITGVRSVRSNIQGLRRSMQRCQ